MLIHLGIDVVYVQNHIKNGINVPDHLHLNVTYGLITSKKNTIRFNENEHSGLKWFSIDNYEKHVSEERMLPIYNKLLKLML